MGISRTREIAPSLLRMNNRKEQEEGPEMQAADLK
jgi:hypothetical protein